MDRRSSEEDGTSNATVPIMLSMSSSLGAVVVSVVISSTVCEYKNVLLRVAMFDWYRECRRRSWLLLTKDFVVVDRRVGVVKDKTKSGV